MSEVVKVGLSELKVSSGEIMVSQALGSCVALILFDPEVKAGGLAHIMLPECRKDEGDSPDSAKFADKAVVRLIRQMEERGAKRNCMIAKIVGGASMFSSSSKDGKLKNDNTGCGGKSGSKRASKDSYRLTDIGSRNVKVVKEKLAEEVVRLAKEDVGGNHARTVEFNTATGRVVIRSMKIKPNGEVKKEFVEL